MWEAHTQHCRYCQAAYRNLQAIKHAAIAVLGGALLALPAASRRRTVIAVSAAVVAAALHWFNRLFVRYEYSHADND